MKRFAIISVLFFCICMSCPAEESAGLFSRYKDREHFLPRDPEERNAIRLGEAFVNGIQAKKTLSRAEEERLFGPFGGILGESLYASLGMVALNRRQEAYFTGRAAGMPSPLGILLIKKLHPLLTDKVRVTYCLGCGLHTYDRQGIGRAGPAVETYLLLRAVPESASAFRDNENGLTILLALRKASAGGKSFFIDLVDSCIGHIPLYQLLGFQGSFASALKLPEAELRLLEKELRK